MRPANQLSRIVCELPPGLCEVDWCVASDRVRGGEVPQPVRQP